MHFDFDRNEGTPTEEEKEGDSSPGEHAIVRLHLSIFMKFVCFNVFVTTPPWPSAALCVHAHTSGLHFSASKASVFTRDVLDRRTNVTLVDPQRFKKLTKKHYMLLNKTVSSSAIVHFTRSSSADRVCPLVLCSEFHLCRYGLTVAVKAEISHLTLRSAVGAFRSSSGLILSHGVTLLYTYLY